jgi:hypothetical protein
VEYRGTIRSGVVVLESGAGAALPDGTQVRVTPVEAPQPAAATPGDAPGSSGTLAFLLKFAGVFRGPPDLARNHDHYIHGTPRRE